MNREELLSIRAQVVETLISIDRLLEPDPLDFSPVEEEQADNPIDAYRGGNPNGQLLPLGVRVMYRMFERGFPVEVIAERMKVGEAGVRERRRAWLKLKKVSS